MELAQVEAFAELVVRARAEFFDLELAYLVCERLSGVCDVAVNLVRHVQLGLGGVLHEVVNGLLPVPLVVVHPCVNDEAHRAPHLVCELPELRIGVVVESHVFA